MIWAIVSSRSCFCWLYTASQSLATKNVISLISVLTLWWCPCIKYLVLLENGVCYARCVLFGRILLAFALLHSVLLNQTSLLLQVSLDFLLLHSNPQWRIGHLFFLVLILGGFLGLHRPGQLQLLQHWCLGHRLGLLWCWIVCLRNKLRSFYHF